MAASINRFFPGASLFVVLIFFTIFSSIANAQKDRPKGPIDVIVS